MAEFKLLRKTLLLFVFLNICYFIKVYHFKDDNKFNKILVKEESVYSPYSEDKIIINFKKDYSTLNTRQKVIYLLNQVAANKNDQYWLANTTMENPSISLNPKDFLPPVNENEMTWQNNPLLYYEPRFTIAVILDELKHQLQTHNPDNTKENDHLIQIPFSWSDWVDLTDLNGELLKPVEERKRCKWLQKNANKETKYPDFCKDLVSLTDEEVEEIGLTREEMPGYVVKTSPMNKAPHKEVLMQGKSYLLSQQENPLTIVFLTSNGTYEAQITGKRQKLVQTDLFKNYLTRRNIDPTKRGNIPNVDLNPQKVFQDLLSTVPPRPLNPKDDTYDVSKVTQHKEDTSVSRQIHIDPSAFHYGQEDIDRQIAQYEKRITALQDAITNEIKYEPSILEHHRLDRHELNHYNGLKYCNSFTPKDEPTYYKLATLRKTKENLDSGWHYEWRFFNGGMRHLKDETWTYPQLEVREQIILDRLLRNWFKFAESKGIISWIAHGPLLSWYWDGLMFPFDIDIDLQMPSSELNRLASKHNMTLVIEDLNEGYGKYLIDCSTFIHHRNVAGRDNHIDARFIDIDTGTYIDITGIGINDEKPPSFYDEYISSKKENNEPVELYMDRRKHWLNYEKINPLRYSMLGGVPVFIPNDIMAMLNNEYSRGTKSFYYEGYYYVPQVRLWLQEKRILPLFSPEEYEAPTEDARQANIINLIKTMTLEDKVELLEQNQDILVEYYLTQKYTGFHEIERRLMMDDSMQKSILNLDDSNEYKHLTAKFELGEPVRKSLFDFLYYGRFKYMPAPPRIEQELDETSDAQKTA
ncbi:Mannosylphosphorylation of N-linked oligosaccharides effector, putative [Candida maltosa Xu316]|uniref:Mannosylphosphorylation of N-linked oligosaccharides effector, putative n=1 Tax=Candida maltosa (strain Xu316) TaxID=1245528 RepID=M3J410_CANMX|nr:Mannosylphosphorylation of N-linked oligosaccharides effector, putative [Candida maltosa Xu316]